MPGGFKEQKTCLVEIEQTARPLETNPHANFPMAENAAYQCIENGGWKHAHKLYVCGTLCVSDTMFRQSQESRRVPREHAECFLSIVGHTNAEQRYH